jgi:hypothetical protein
MGESQSSSERPFVSTDRIRILLPEASQLATDSQSITLIANNETFDEELARSLESIKMVIIRNSLTGDDFAAVAEVVPTQYDSSEGVEASFLRLQSRLGARYEGSGLDDLYIEEGEAASFVRMDAHTFIEVRPVGGESPHPTAIAMQSISEDMLEVYLNRPIAPHYTYNQSQQQRIGAFLEVWAEAIDSVTVSTDDELHHIDMTRIPHSPFHMSATKIQTLLERSRQGEKLRHHQYAERTRRVERLGQHLDRMGGLRAVKDRLHSIGLTMIDSAAVTTYNLITPSFFLHGPPGTGKTSLVHAFAEGVGAELYVMKGGEVDSRFYGEAAANVIEHFKKATSDADKHPVIIFIDEIDTLIRQRDDPHGHYGNIIKAFNTEMDQLRVKYPNKVIVAGTTNLDPSYIDPSISRSGRLEGIHVPQPTPEERYDIWGSVLLHSVNAGSTMELYGPDINLGELANKTEGLNGADFEKILQNVRQQKYVQFMTTGEHQLVTQMDILRAIKAFRP